MELGDRTVPRSTATVPELPQGRNSGGDLFGAGVRAGLTAAILAPLALAWLSWHAIHSGWYDIGTALVVFSTSIALIFALLTFWLVTQIHRMDRRRQDATTTRMRDLLESTPDAMVVVDDLG